LLINWRLEPGFCDINHTYYCEDNSKTSPPNGKQQLYLWEIRRGAFGRA
jgi:hypothetical protein